MAKTNHKAKLREAEARANALKNADQLSEASIWDLTKEIAAKVVNTASELKEDYIVSSDPTTRKEQEFIRKVNSANLRSECEAVGTAAGQFLRKGVDVAWGASKGILKGITTGGGNGLKKTKKQSPPVEPDSGQDS